ncbi:MAG: elongation factor P [Sphingomonadales bacterium]|nr:elongation factor P [Sphingomonadales bacterium]
MAGRRWQLAACLAGLLAGPAWGDDGSSLGTLRIGRYVCELPGNANGPVGVRQPGEDFAILHSSRYAVGNETGVYLLIGDQMQFTSGPKRGARYRRVSENFLRKLADDGSDGPLRCVRGVLNNGG